MSMLFGFSGQAHRSRQTVKALIVAVAMIALSGCAAPPPPPRASLTPQPSPSPAATSTPTPAPAPAITPLATISSPASSPADEALWATLRAEPGLVVLFRHALAPGTGDPANFTLDDCSTQRNLSDEGREQARQIGLALREQHIPVARVLSSQWCRSLETAQLMDIGAVEPFPPINSFFQDRSTQDAQTAQVRRFMYDSRATTSVVVMVTHQVNITALTGIVPRQGAAVVVRSLGPDEIGVVGQWTP